MIKNNLKPLLEKKGLNYKDLAKMFGVNPSTAWRWVNDKTHIREYYVKQIEGLADEESR